MSTDVGVGVGERVIRKRALVEVDFIPEAWRKEHGDENESRERVLEDVNYAWHMTDVARVLRTSSSALSTCATVKEITVGPRDRSDEAGFRQIVPRWVGTLEILAVHGFTPGGEGVYAAAIALSKAGYGTAQQWGTHILLHQDELPEYEFILTASHYTHDEAKARAWLVERAS